MQRPGEALAPALHAMSLLVTEVTGLLLTGRRTQVPTSSVLPTQNSWNVACALTEAASKREDARDANFMMNKRGGLLIGGLKGVGDRGPPDYL